MKRSVALAIRDPAQPGAVLLVQRPPDDEDLPNVWGLPAASLTDGESWEEAALRAGREKLGITLALGPVLESGSLERPACTLDMRLYEARVLAGTPAVPQPGPHTQYRRWRWGAPAALEDAADRGSLCSRLYLRWVLARGGENPRG